jgi:hypothetical protein
MDYSTQIAAKNLHDFFRSYQKHLGRVNSRKIFSFLKGMIQGRTVQMCEAGRTIEPKKTPKNFCEKTSKTLRIIDYMANLHLCKFRKRKFKYFIIDESDIQRRYAKKLNAIKKVRDGSLGNNDGKGYPLIAVIGITVDGEYIPLILRRYREGIQTARIQCVDDILKVFGPDHGAIWLLDRGFDDKKFINLLLYNQQEFLIRLDRRGGERCLEVEDGERYTVSQLTAHMEKVGYRRVCLPGSRSEVSLVHYHSHGKKEPMALLTTLSPKTLKQAKRIAKMYITRWKIEDYLLFIKQRFNLEKMRVQLPENVDGLLVMTLIASHFVMKETFEMETSQLKVAFEWWRKLEDTTLCWSAVCRFYQYMFRNWEITPRNLRTSSDTPNPLQLQLFTL